MIHAKSREEGGIFMTGTYQHTLDAKGRLFIPSKLREELGDVFYVTISQENCLHAYNEENWKRLCDKAAEMPYSAQGKLRPMFANASRCELDAQGRILLSQMLRSRAHLNRDVTIIGVNNHAEFWDKAEWDGINAEESTPENIAAVMDSLGF